MPICEYIFLFIIMIFYGIFNGCKKNYLNESFLFVFETCSWENYKNLIFIEWN